MRDTVAQYLDRYADPLARQSVTPPRVADAVVVVPAFDERVDFLRRFAATDFGRHALMIAVLNAPRGADRDAYARTLDLLRDAQALYTGEPAHGEGWQAGTLTASSNALLLVDRVQSGPRPAPEHGVGAARRVGMDVALALMHRSLVRSTLIVSSDADATLPANLFAAETDTSEVALAFAFRHEAPAELAEAQAVYDLRLRYYRNALARCGSPYAFIALGSALAVDGAAYAAVRGVPRRAAGEDFYLLNKLAKIGTIRGCGDIDIALAARRSRRVPFGTGPGVERLGATDDPRRRPFFYAPASFAHLGVWLKTAQSLLAASAPWPAPAAIVEQAHRVARDVGIDWSAFAQVFADEATHDALLTSLRASADPGVRVRHFHMWFDGLQTLRSIHRLRALGHADISAAQLEAERPEWVADSLADARRDWRAGVS